MDQNIFNSQMSVYYLADTLKLVIFMDILCCKFFFS